VRSLTRCVAQCTNASLTPAVVLVVVLAGGAAAADQVAVGGGPFWMGSDRDDPAEAPRHRVEVGAFRIDRHKVTNREVALFLNARGLKSPEGEDRYDWDDADARIHRVSGRWVADPGFEDHPAVEVSWFGARDYCAWRGQRLPTEAEWEKAARGPDGRRHPWGDEPPTPERAVYDRPYNHTERVGARPAGASPYGAHDMVGNLREWTSSQFRPYPYRADDGREAPDRAATRVVRGASHDDGPEGLRASIRRHYGHSGTARGHHHVGFRCAR
jgi:formylglycine-generating enzyme required for sulfatase activity